jgi:hypothetical protein
MNLQPKPLRALQAGHELGFGQAIHHSTPWATISLKHSLRQVLSQIIEFSMRQCLSLVCRESGPEPVL